MKKTNRKINKEIEKKTCSVQADMKNTGSIESDKTPYMIRTEKLGVGYGKKILISDIEIELKPGEIVTLIGPNGSGKSTILKTLVGQLKVMDGSVSVLGRNMGNLKEAEMALHVSMVMTERIRADGMKCRDVISTGRYPYTGRLGILSETDRKAVDDAVKLVHADDVADSDFSSISDGQRQRVMLARAICQDTEIIVLDEPTSFLDMYYKLDILKTIRKLAKEQGKAVIMSLHELDLVRMIADMVVCVDGSKVVRTGSPAEIFTGNFIQKLYGVKDDEFDPETGALHLRLEDDSASVMDSVLEKTSCPRVNPDAEKVCISNGKRNHAKIIMVQGTMSNAGKSLLAAGLCRVFHQDGYRVAPFKSQNMALNSFITKEGLEMGRAQVMQAEAAGVEPLTCMNPILLKPTDDKGSQVIVNGEVLGNMKARDYFKYKKKLVPDILKAFSKLEEQADIIVIEGAGSPAEINLRADDIVNMGLAEMLDAPVLLVGDIDRGGVFAQLLGTIQLLSPSEKERVKGLVINKFRGDKTILDPGIDMLEDMGGIPVTGVIPYMDITLDDEDSLSTRFSRKKESLINIGVVRFPRISNFTDFSVFEQLDDVSLHYVSSPEELYSMDMLILPGSKNTIGDLKWLRESGMEAAIKHMAPEKPVFGICGGYQMLGRMIHDPQSVEAGGSMRGMELLDVETVLMPQKTRTQCGGTIEMNAGPFSCLDGKSYAGYEIHMGNTSLGPDAVPVTKGAACGNVCGTYVHGIFDEGDIASSIVNVLAERKGVVLEGNLMDYKAFKETQYDKLADTVRQYMDMKAVYAMLREARFSGEE